MYYTDPTKEYDPDPIVSCPNCGETIIDFLTNENNYEWVEEPEVVQMKAPGTATFDEHGELVEYTDDGEFYEDVMPGTAKCNHCGDTFSSDDPVFS